MPTSSSIIDFETIVASGTPLVVHRTSDDSLLFHLYEIGIKKTIVKHQSEDNYKACKVFMYDSKSGVVDSTPVITGSDLELKKTEKTAKDESQGPRSGLPALPQSPLTRINNMFNEAEKRSKTEKSRYFVILRDVDDMLRNNGQFLSLLNRFTDDKDQRSRMSVYIITTLGDNELPVEYQRIGLVQHYPYADDDQILAILSKSQEPIVSKNAKRLVATMRGLTFKQMVNYMPLALKHAKEVLGVTAKKGSDSPEVLEEFIRVMDDFKQSIQKVNYLQMERPKRGLIDIGGNDLFKQKIGILSKIFRAKDKASDFSIRKTKGLLLTGLPGTGKSTMSKAIAYEFDIPYVRLSLNQMYGKFLGESETRLKQTLDFANSIGALVEIDEIDKELQPDKETNATEGRVVASLLTYMAGDHNIVFVGTANTIDHLPEALYRKGRFDEIFFFDLPNREERASIFLIHLKKAGIEAEKNPEEFNHAVDHSVNFVGAEIQWAIEETTRLAFVANLEKGKSDVATFWKTLYNVLDGVVPHAIHKKEAIKRARTALVTIATPSSSGSKFHSEFAAGLKVRQKNEEI